MSCKDCENSECKLEVCVIHGGYRCCEICEERETCPEVGNCWDDEGSEE